MWWQFLIGWYILAQPFFTYVPTKYVTYYQDDSPEYEWLARFASWVFSPLFLIPLATILAIPFLIVSLFIFL